MDETEHVYGSSASKMSDDEARAIAEIVDEIAGADGVCEPKALLEVARDPSSPAHKFFEWDDEKAAEAHRVSQARTLIRAVRIISETADGPREVHRFHSVKLPDGPKGYVGLARVTASRDLASQVIRSSMQRLAMWRQQAESLRAVIGDTLLDQVDAALKDHGFKPPPRQGGSPAAPPG